MSSPSDRAGTLASATLVTHDPRRLEALCELWKGAGRTVWLTLQGYSMAPTLLPGTRLKIRCGAPLGEMAVGDIVAFRQEGSLVIHRVVSATKNGGEPTRFVCKGDNNPENDPPVGADRIVGLVISIRPPALLTRIRKRLGHYLLSRRRRMSVSSRPEAAP